MRKRVIGTFFVPAVVDTSRHDRDWRYSGWRVVVTEGADPRWVQRLTTVSRVE